MKCSRSRSECFSSASDSVVKITPARSSAGSSKFAVTRASFAKMILPAGFGKSRGRVQVEGSPAKRGGATYPSKARFFTEENRHSSLPRVGSGSASNSSHAFAWSSLNQSGAEDCLGPDRIEESSVDIIVTLIPVPKQYVLG